MREILTIQVGDYANLTGSYYWETEKKKMEQYYRDKSYEVEDFGILFSDSPHRGITRKPRLVCLRQKGFKFSSNRLRPVGVSRTNSCPPDKGIEDIIAKTWDGEVERIEPEKLFISDQNDQVANQEEELNLQPKPFSCGEHSNSLCEFPFYQGCNLDSPCSYFMHGYDLIQEKTSWLVDDVMDGSIRYFAEDSDYLQGFQVFGDLGTAVPGITVALVKEIRDQYPKCSILNVGLKRPLTESTTTQTRTTLIKPSKFDKMDEALFVGSLSGEDVLTVFLKQPRNSDMNACDTLEGSSSHHSIILESLLLPARLSQEYLDLKSLFNVITSGGKRWFPSVSASILVGHEDLLHLHLNNLHHFLKPFGPHDCVPLSEFYGSILVSRGIVRQLLNSVRHENDFPGMCFSEEYVRKDNPEINNLSYMFAGTLPISDVSFNRNNIQSDADLGRGTKSIVCLSSGKANFCQLNDLLNSLSTSNVLGYLQAASLQSSSQIEIWENTKTSIEDMLDLYT